MKTLKIEMIHDVVCSWCHIGYHNLTRALDKFKTELEVEFRYLPFQLNRDLPHEGVDIVSHLRARNHWNEEQAANYRKDLLARAHDLGVTIDFDKRTRYYNTESAHRLILYAQIYGKQREIHALLLDAYHVHGKNIAEPAVLVELAQHIGLESEQVITAFKSDNIENLMQQAQARVSHYAVKTVPAFIFNDFHFVSGSHTPAYFETLIRSDFLDIETELKEPQQCLM